MMPIESRPDPARDVLAWGEAHRWWLFAIVVIAYVGAFNGQHHVGDDSSFYASIGRNLAEGRGFTYHGQPDTIAFPALPVLIGVCYTVSPDHAMVLAHLALLAMALLTLVCVYGLMRLHVQRNVAVLTVTIFGLSRIMHEHAFRLLTDVPFALGVVASLLGYALVTRCGKMDAPGDGRRSAWGWPLLAMGLALAVTSRVVMMALVLSLVIACGWRVVRGNDKWRHAGVLGVTIGVVALFYMFDPRRSPQGYVASRTYEAGLVRYLGDLGATLWRAATESVPTLFRTAAAEGTFGLVMGEAVQVPLSVLALGCGVVGAWRRPLWMVFFLVNLAVMLMFSPSRRYFLPLLPIMMLGYVMLTCHLGNRLGRPRSDWAVAAMIVLILVPNVIKVVDVVIEQRRVPFLEHYKDGRCSALLDVAAALQEHTEPDAVILADHATILTFYGRRTVLAAGELMLKRPTPQQIRATLAAQSAVYAVLPGDEALHGLIKELAVEIGPAIVSVQRHAGKERWTLHGVRCVPTGAERDGRP